MHIAVIGSGYVGLVTGACFAEFGVDVTCVDTDAEKIARLAQGQTTIYEPGLDQLLNRNLQAGRLSFTTDIRSAIEESLVIFLAVGTPPKDDGSADLTYVNEAAFAIAANMNDYKVVVTKSTVPVGTGRRLATLIREHQRVAVEFGVVSNPEFLREGAAISDFMRPDRVVIGSNVHEVARAIGMDRRIGAKFLHPGPGFGGSCFPKDARALLSIAKQFSCQTRIVDAVIEVNELQRQSMVPKIERLAGGLKGKRVAVLGLAFKPETDDIREAPALDIIRGLIDRGATVSAYDPVASSAVEKLLPQIEYAPDEYAAAMSAEVLVFVTEWNQFR